MQLQITITTTPEQARCRRRETVPPIPAPPASASGHCASPTAPSASMRWPFAASTHPAFPHSDHPSRAAGTSGPGNHMHTGDALLPTLLDGFQLALNHYFQTLRTSSPESFETALYALTDKAVSLPLQSPGGAPRQPTFGGLSPLPARQAAAPAASASHSPPAAISPDIPCPHCGQPVRPNQAVS